MVPAVGFDSHLFPKVSQSPGQYCWKDNWYISPMVWEFVTPLLLLWLAEHVIFHTGFMWFFYFLPLKFSVLSSL